MKGTLPNKTKQLFFTLIKLSIVIGASFFIYNKLAHNNNLNFSVFIAFSSKSGVFLLKNIPFLLFLTVFNWFCEIKKWQNLVLYVKTISFFEACKQSLAAHTVSIFTPNKIGEYGAKVVYFSKSSLKRILLLNLLGNIAQMCTTLLFGIIGLAFFISQNNIQILYYKFYSLIILVLIIVALVLFGSKLNKFNIKGFSLQGLKTSVLKISTKIHFKNFVFSVIKYLIFSFQFYYLLLLFNVDISYFNAMIAITTMYLFSSIIPTIFVLDVVVKGSIALYLFNFIGVNEITILSVITLMWILNFVLPSIFGGYYILNFDYNKTLYSNNLD